MVKVVQAIVKLYFFGAIAGSTAHILEAGQKLGLSGWEQWTTPLLIDGIAVIGLIMRSQQFSIATRQLGLRVQVVMGSVSLVANVYAASNIGERIYGIAIVATFLGAEWLADRLESVQVDKARELAAKRSQAAKRAAQTRAKNRK